MKVRRKKNVRFRDDPGFGGIIYVHHRNDFFAANFEVYQAARALTQDYNDVPENWKETYIELAKLGICETLGPSTHEIPYSGPSLFA